MLFTSASAVAPATGELFIVYTAAKIEGLFSLVNRIGFCYTKKRKAKTLTVVMAMYFEPYIFDQENKKIQVEIGIATKADIEKTKGLPKWQTEWDTEYLEDPAFDKYAMNTMAGELVALAAYSVMGNALAVKIVYMESQPESNPTITEKSQRKYHGIGQALIAFGIKLSVDEGIGGAVIFDAKTSELAKHYAEDFKAIRLPNPDGPATRFLLADEGAMAIFTLYLTEEGE